MISEWTGDIHEGDAEEVLAELPESSVHCVVTSPPYFGHRDYGVDGQIGLEDSLDEFIESLVDVASEIRRVLRDDGSWWLNLGDSFAGSGGAGGQWGQNEHGSATRLADAGDAYNGPLNTSNIRRKSKMLVPHRVAIALENAGWIIRADAVWTKPNGMPSSAHDRLNEKKEFVFHLVPEPHYWFNLDAIREPHSEASLERAGRHDQAKRGYPSNDHSLEPSRFCHPNGKNPGDIFEINAAQFSDAHFAVFPEELCKDPIKSSCPEKVCAECGTPHEQLTEEIDPWNVESPDREQLRRAIEVYKASDLTEDHLEAVRAYGFADAAAGKNQNRSGLNDERVQQLASEAKDVLEGYFREFTTTYERHIGWEAACDCETDETNPGIVLDPFAGAGTTCLVAKRFGRRFIGVDLNPEFVAMAQQRIGLDVDDPDLLLDEDETSLREFIEVGDTP
ncbi:DNA methyltransferase [Natrialba phage PhiCh1]|nr:site-specific DNA-methyltransferase [Natrialba magadii]NP_666000.1 DNA methyltransferase [Natrialba phage PhiCh1]YP_010078109.1 DNA methyltransferase [Natrialba phage PhiCh1]AAM88756.1 putative N4-cytosine methyltransferase [Natrialba phage PhiCh1]QBJ01260.1 putative N4-cytosine methyltransferase [Natrialba phage PhiCh1]